MTPIRFRVKLGVDLEVWVSRCSDRRRQRFCARCFSLPVHTSSFTSPDPYHLNTLSLIFPLIRCNYLPLARLRLPLSFVAHLAQPVNKHTAAPTGKLPQCRPTTETSTTFAETVHYLYVISSAKRLTKADRVTVDAR